MRSGRLCLIYIFLFLFGLTVVSAQDETSNWFFGERAGLKFNANGTVTVVTDGQLSTVEGCTSISDNSGNLLFYTDGIRVYNRNHQVMVNGTGLNGDPSSTQSGLIVPHPGNSDLFYVFTVDTFVSNNDSDLGFGYSLVDMSADNGLGAVTTKNVNLLRDSSEKISSVIKDCTTGTFWVITFASKDGDNSQDLNTFFCYEINMSGLMPVPVKSTIQGLSIDDARGAMKLSPDGSKLAMANAARGLYLFDFDASTGSVSNMMTLNAPDNSYGIEFSPNNRFLYVNTYTEDIPQNTQPLVTTLYQFDLQSADINASRVLIDQRNGYRGALQLAGNGKIYRALSESYQTGSPYLGVIENPNAQGTASNYRHNAINLNGKLSRQGLPPFIQSYFNKIDIINNGSSTNSFTLCEGDSYRLQAPSVQGATYVWSLNMQPLPNTTSYLDIDQAKLTDEGNYQVEINYNNGQCPDIGEALLNVLPAPVIVNSSLVQCDVDAMSTDRVTVFNLLEASDEIKGGDNTLQVSFYETTNDLDNNNSIADASSYIGQDGQVIYSKVTNTNGCSASGELMLIVNPTTGSLPVAGPYYACGLSADSNIQQGLFDLEDIRQTAYAGLSVQFFKSLNNAVLEQDPIITPTFQTPTTTLFVRIEDNNECQGIEQFDLIVDDTPQVNIESEYFICLNDPILELIAEDGYDRYDWYMLRTDGTEIQVSNTQGVTLTQAGKYRLMLTKNYLNPFRQCTNYKDFTLYPSNIATFIPVPEVRDLSDNNIVTVFSQGEGNYMYSIDGINFSESNIFENVPAGFHTVYIKDINGCGVTEKTISVIGYDKFFTPNNDGINDRWQIKGISQDIQRNSMVFIFDRYGKLIKQLDPLSPGWDGTFNQSPMPQSDYWFRISLEDGREFKGHFSLVR